MPPSDFWEHPNFDAKKTRRMLFQGILIFSVNVSIENSVKEFKYAIMEKTQLR